MSNDSKKLAIRTGAVLAGALVPLSSFTFGLLPSCSTRPDTASEPVQSVGQASGGAVDTMRLSDEPGNWFRSDATGTSVSIIGAGQGVDFVISNCCTTTRHTVTLLVKPVGSSVTMDQDKAQNGSLSVRFDVPGVYVFVCKIHPYMTAVVAVKDAQGKIPEVTSASLPFIGHLGAGSLPAGTVLSVLRPIAATDADKAAKWDIWSAGDARLRTPTTAGVGEVWISSQFERVPGAGRR